ncbi:hypothetical protein JVT61DRAFT_8552 [Boletus reticuloceps]|uniref:G domain-containing protein n=1 Tax=Boletus reticuloceps TaxID=495285 RepID=A0A8I2Z1A0_9AGAM|nr:hypothetical protein JVT61DRAFT_8552 [Boletus reticuloceps]
MLQATVTVSAESPNQPKRLTSGELRIGPRRHKLICDEDGTLRQEFPNVVELSPAAQITLLYKSSWLSGTKTRTINTQSFFANYAGAPTQGLSVVQDGIRVTFSYQATAAVFSTPRATQTVPPTAQTSGTLSPTTQAILEDCPQFRILVIGKSGVGKSSLINTAFGIHKACAANFMRGKANIEEGLESPVNERFILHDSLGFEPGDKDNYNTVKDFIRNRQTGLLKDQLHAVWFCVQIPRAGGRLLEIAAEDFFRTKKKTMGTIPLIVVYTMLDSLVDEMTMQLAMSSNSELDDESLTRNACLKAASSVRERHKGITRLTGEPLPYAIVSTRENYRYTLQTLVELTHQQVGIRDTPGAQITSVVTLMAQRVAPHLKIQGSIDIGRQRYWKALRTGPDFIGHTIWDCLSVIHADIVAVWNFNDPTCHLLDNKFKELVIKMVQEMQMRSVPNPNRILALGGGSLVAAASGFLAAILNPAAPIVLPIVAGIAAAVWVYDVYQNVKNVQQIFMAFIVDLTHIMETLFILTGRDHKKLTRRAIKLAYTTYHESGVMGQAHTDIQGYRDRVGRDGTLELIESLIKPERSGDLTVKDYFAEISKLDIQKLNLDQEEEW